MFAGRLLKQSAVRVGRAAFSSAASEAPAGSFLDTKEVTRRVLSVVRSVRPCPENVTVDQNFAGDLQFDSMLRKGLNDSIAEEFCLHIPDAEREKFVSGAAVVNYISKHPKAR